MVPIQGPAVTTPWPQVGAKCPLIRFARPPLTGHADERAEALGSIWTGGGVRGREGVHPIAPPYFTIEIPPAHPRKLVLPGRKSLLVN